MTQTIRYMYTKTFPHTYTYVLYIHIHPTKLKGGMLNNDTKQYSIKSFAISKFLSNLYICVANRANVFG